MKIAVSGKGGVGKTTLSAFLIKGFADKGMRVLAIDADPDANLAQALGFSDADRIVPISNMKQLIEERTGAKPGSFGSFFKMNPKVDDLPEKLSLKKGNIRLMVMGGVKRGGSGCVCPESVLLKTLVTHLILARDEVVLLDMEAGLEHLGRGTAQSVNHLIVVVEPGRRSIETALQVERLASDLGLKNLSIVGNKIRNEDDKEYIKKKLKDFNILGFLPYDPSIIEADLKGMAPFDMENSIEKEAKAILEQLAIP